MIGVVVVSHGRLGQVLLETAAEIVGPLPCAEAVAVGRSQAIEEIAASIRAAVDRVEHPGGVLILADAYGGTAANVALQLVGERRLEVVTGCNLPMLLKLKSAIGTVDDVETLARILRDYGQKNVVVASSVLRGREVDDD